MENKIEWPELSFEEINHYNVDSKFAGLMYKGLVAILLLPEIIVRAFYEVLRFKL